MSAQTLLKGILDDLKSRDEFVLALAIQRIGDRLIVHDGDDDAAEIGVLSIGDDVTRCERRAA